METNSLWASRQGEECFLDAGITMPFADGHRNARIITISMPSLISDKCWWQRKGQLLLVSMSHKKTSASRKTEIERIDAYYSFFIKSWHRELLE